MLNNKDTNICFTIPQSKLLLKFKYKADELAAFNAVCEQQKVLKDSVINQKSLVIADQLRIMNNQKLIIYVKDTEISDLKTQLEAEKKATKRQRVYKMCFAIGGGVLSSYLGYKYLTK